MEHEHNGHDSTEVDLNYFYFRNIKEKTFLIKSNKNEKP